jgi:flagellar assembly protein FliH
MSEPPDSADPKPDDTLPPLDADVEPVTDPLALTMGATGPLELPEPILGSDEDDPSAGFGAPDGGLERPSFLADLAARNGGNSDDALADEDAPAFDEAPSFDDVAEAAHGESTFVESTSGESTSLESKPAEPAHDPNAPVLVSELGTRRRVWHAIRYAAVTTEKPVVEPPPPVIDDRGRLVRKYLFERSFDPLEPAPEPEPEPELTEPEPEPIELIAEEPPPPTFSEDELAGARAAGHADGEAAGRQAAAAGTEAQLAQLMQQIAGYLPGLADDRDQAVSAVAHEAARLAHAMVRRMMPELARRYRVEEIEAVVVDSLSKALDLPRILIRAPADIAGYLGDRLETVARQHGFAGRVVVLSDQNLGPSDVKVEWGDGGAERCVQRAWSDLEATVQRVVAKLEQVAPVAEIPEGASEDTIGSAA